MKIVFFFLKIFRRCFSALVLLFLYILHLACLKYSYMLPSLDTLEFHFILVIYCNRIELNSLGNSSVVCETYNVEDKKHRVMCTYWTQPYVPECKMILVSLFIRWKFEGHRVIMHKLFKHNLYRYFHDNFRLWSGSPYTQVIVVLL